MIPNSFLFEGGEAFAGGTLTRNVCWQVAASEVGTLQMFYEPFSGAPVFFALQVAPASAGRTRTSGSPGHIAGRPGRVGGTLESGWRYFRDVSGELVPFCALCVHLECRPDADAATTDD